MNTTTPQETVVRLRQSLRRQGVVVWVLGILLTLSGVGVAVSPSVAFGSARTEGTVIKLEPEVEVVVHGIPQAGEIVWYEQVEVAYPVVEYQVSDRKYTYRSRSSFGSYTVGQKVPVLYKVDRPGVARIDTFSDRWLVPLLVGGGSLLSGVFILVVMALSQRWYRQLEATLIEGSRGVEGQKGPGQTASSSA